MDARSGSGRNRFKKLTVFLREDVPALEEEYENFLQVVELETDDPQWAIDNHKATKLLERFDPLFHQWVNRLYEMRGLRESGFPLERDDLTLIEWKALALIDQFIQEKRNARQKEIYRKAGL